MIVPENIEKIFISLDKQIQVHGGQTISLVVCGGTALSAMGLVNRTTKDVDVLGEIEFLKEKIVVKRIKKFPSWFDDAAKIIQRDFNLPNNWINTGPSAQVDSGLPDSFENRLIRKQYGSYLAIYFISRIDQIFFKLYASIDRGGYHVDDLFKLKPIEREIESASHWLLTQDVSEGFKLILVDFLNKKGFTHVATRL